MATTPVDSGGTQSAPSPMVAVPGAREAPVILGTGIGMSMPKMECKINLRSGNQDAWRRWTVNRNDVITAHGLDALMDNQLMPTVDVIGERFPNLSSAERQEALVASTKQYLSENTQLYFLMKDSVDISGAYEQLDTDYINKSFVGAAGSRSLRDGLGFLNWVESFFDITKDDAQILLKRQFSSKMKVNPTGVSIAVLEVCYARLTYKSGGHGSQPLVRGFETTVSDLYETYAWCHRAPGWRPHSRGLRGHTECAFS